MKVDFYATGSYMVSPAGCDVCYPFSELGKAIDFVADNWVEGNGDVVDIVDAETGEILVHFEDDEPDDDYRDFEFPDLDFGFDVYMGCYTWDC